MNFQSYKINSNKARDRERSEGLDADDIRPKALLYQTGYLTIKDYNPRGNIYTLGLPNDEVKEGFFEYILPYYSRLDSIPAPKSTASLPGSEIL